MLLLLYIAPYLIAHWRHVESEAAADARYLFRQAELRAEAQHAEQRLELLDRRVHLTSLGFREVIRKVARQVVSVANCRASKTEPGIKKSSFEAGPLFVSSYIQNGVGSGVIVKPGYVLTNHHVVKDAEQLLLTFSSGQTLELDFDAVSSDPLTDLAVIRLPAELPQRLREDAMNFAEFADSDQDVQVGDWAIAVGSPLGLRHTVTQGIISAKGRLLSMLDAVELLQTDAAINPGNSGGPLFDQMGRVVGINVAIASDNGANQGIGFAIPGNTARRISEQLISRGQVLRGYLGAVLEDIVEQDEEMPDCQGGRVLIADVLPGKAAANAGLTRNDVVVAFAGRPLSILNPLRDLRERIFATPPGQNVAIEIEREGERRTLELCMGQRPRVKR